MILITGATGTIGAEVIRLLAETTTPVRATTRNPDKELKAGADIEWVYGDFSQPDTLRRALNGVDRALLLSAATPDQDELQANFIDAACSAGVRHIVKISALGADIQARFSVGRLHAETERQIEKSGISFTHLRPHFFMQNFLKLAATIRAQDKFFAPLGEARISLVDARDIASVAVAVLLQEGHEGNAYPITGPEALSYADVAITLSQITGRTITYVPVSPQAARQAMLDRSMPPWLVDSIVGLYDAFRTGEWESVSSVIADITGKPARTFSTFARDHKPSFQPNH